MSRFLFAMWEGGGTVPPEIGVAGRLIRRDHQVHVIGDPTIEMPAHRVGATFTAWRDAPHVTSLRPEDALVRDWEIRKPFKLFAAMRDALICGPTPRFGRETLAAIETFDPDHAQLIPQASVVRQPLRARDGLEGVVARCAAALHADGPGSGRQRGAGGVARGRNPPQAFSVFRGDQKGAPAIDLRQQVQERRPCPGRANE